MVGSRQWLTVSEVAKVAGQLAGQPCSPRQVRHLLVRGGLGTDTRRRMHGQTRLYGTLDVAFVRLALRLQAEGVSPWVVRVVLTYLRNDLVMAWKSSAAVALAIQGLKGTLEPALRSRPAALSAWVPLREIGRGIDTEIQRTRDAHETVWMWRKVSVNAVPRAAP
jgi:DNA-binding transcriptional MerR regulator